MFPHYTWGCITDKRDGGSAYSVPSLYVRMYRKVHWWYVHQWSSLTIREGVSIGFAVENGILGVPSLYVRVYHTTRRQKTVLYSSLTIREGVSAKSAAELRQYMFPHYTWGYIVEHGHLVKFWGVPSLCVRVYHGRDAININNVRSLTMRECMLNSRYLIYRLFFLFFNTYKKYFQAY